MSREDYLKKPLKGRLSLRFIAIAEKMERGLVKVFDVKTLKQRKVLSNTEMQSKETIMLLFLMNLNQLLTGTANIVRSSKQNTCHWRLIKCV